MRKRKTKPEWMVKLKMMLCFPNSYRICRKSVVLTLESKAGRMDMIKEFVYSHSLFHGIRKIKLGSSLGLFFSPLPGTKMKQKLEDR